MSLPRRLARRVAEAHGKGRLEQLLRQTRSDLGLPRSAFRVTGTAEELEEAVWKAVTDAHLSVATVARLVDEIEECGAQHIYLYDLTDAGVAALSDEALSAFSTPPAEPTEAFYSAEPTARRTYSVSRDGGVFVKQIYLAEYWEVDPDAGESSVDRRVTVSVRHKRRAVNVFRVDRAARTAEVRIDRVRGRDDRQLAEEAFGDFAITIGGVVDFTEHLAPVSVRPAFRRIVLAKDETFMGTDLATDASVRQSFSSRREGDGGQDVRGHTDWRLDGVQYSRDSVNVFWRLGEGDGRRMVHTIIRAVQRTVAEVLQEHAKVYVAAHVSEEDLAHVIGRIRHFAA